MAAAMPLPIAAFQLVGYSAWNGEDAGSSPACYTLIVMNLEREKPEA
mgnify:CR=1 FL=1